VYKRQPALFLAMKKRVSSILPFGKPLILAIVKR